MSEIILTVDTPVLKGEKGDKGETGVFDYGELDTVVKNNLDSRFSDMTASINDKVDKIEGSSLVQDIYIEKLDKVDTLPGSIVETLGKKIEQSNFDESMELMEATLQNRIDEKMLEAGSGDMLKSVYDKDDDGIIDLAKQADNASRVNGKTVETSVPENAVFTDTTYGEAAPDKAGLMSISDKVKLNGIASGATRVEVVDALDSTETLKALSANQGKVLNENINSVNSSFDEKLNTLTGRIAPLEREQKILWSGGMYMTETQTAQLSENVSVQKNGIVIIMCLYAGGQAKGTDLYYSFVPKAVVPTSYSSSVSCSMHCCTAGFGSIGTKYLHVHNSFIEGHDSNASTGTVSDIAFKNNAWVLYKVVGV